MTLKWIMSEHIFGGRREGEKECLEDCKNVQSFHSGVCFFFFFLTLFCMLHLPRVQTGKCKGSAEAAVHSTL